MSKPPPDRTRFTLAGRPRLRRPRGAPAVPITPEMLEGAPEFAPVPLKPRFDGWTPDRQRAFIKALAETGCIHRAAAWVGMSEVGAYRLRGLPGAEGFTKAWDEARAIGVAKLADIAFERAIYGVAVPVFYKGEKVGERRWYNDRLLMFTLRHQDPANWGGTMNGTNGVPPHIRKALHEEWEREREEAYRAAHGGRSAKEVLGDKLAQMRERLGGDEGEGE